jgi:hypothetical protein
MYANPARNAASPVTWIRWISLAALAMLLAVPAWADGGSIFLTGHDPDFHASRGGNTTGAQHINQIAIGFIQDPAFNPFKAASIDKFLYVQSRISVPGGHTDGKAGIVASGYTEGTDFEHHDASTLDAELNLLGTKYSAIVLASDFGGILTQAELDILNARSGDIIDFLNDGGGIYALSQGNGGAHLTPQGGHFDFLPFIISSTALDQVEVGIEVTPFGASLGLTNSDVNGNASHSFFAGTFGLNAVDLDPQDHILTLAGRGIVDTSGVFGQLVLTQESNENPVNTAHTVTATADDGSGETPLVGVTVMFSVLSGPNAGATGTCAINADCTTDDAGQVGFTYMGSGGPGTDTIRAFFVEAEDDTVFSNFLEKTWVGVSDNQPPVAVCEDVTVSAGEDCEEGASIDAGSFDPDEDPITMTQEPPGPYPVGDTEVKLIVRDDSGAADTCMATVTVVDDIAPQVTVELDHDSLWPPNHKLVEVCAVVTATDNCDSDPSWVLSSITSNEDDEKKRQGGDGNTRNDIQGADLGTADNCMLLRAERSGRGDGRTYTLEFTAQDSSGNSATTTVEVRVEHDQSGKDDDTAGDDGEAAGNRGLDLSAEEYGSVQIEVFDVQGRKVRAFMMNTQSAGSWELGWDGKNSAGRAAPNGIYFYRITTPKRQLVRRVVIAR